MQTATIEVVEAAKAEFARSIDRMKKCLETTPDDKLNWAPAPSARTPLQQVAHSAYAITGIMGMFKGETMDMSDLPKLDAKWREEEKELSTRELALAKLEENASTYNAFLDSLTPEQVSSTFKAPFGEFPMESAITWIADHVRSHCSQIDYIQTCYGDLDWHKG